MYSGRYANVLGPPPRAGRTCFVTILTAVTKSEGNFGLFLDVGLYKHAQIKEQYGNSLICMTVSTPLYYHLSNARHFTYCVFPTRYTYT